MAGEPITADFWDAWMGTTGSETVGGAPVNWDQDVIEWLAGAPMFNWEGSGFDPNVITPAATRDIFGASPMETGRGFTLDTGPFSGLGDRPQFNDVLNALRQAGVTDFRDAPIDGLFVDRAGNIVGSDGAPVSGIALSGLNQFLGSNLGRVATTLGLGGVGLGISRLAAGAPPSLTVPGAPPPSASTAATRAALERALTGTGQQNLADIFASGVQGQTVMANLLRDAAAREGLAQAEQAPGERNARLLALGQLPDYLQTPAAVAGSNATTAGVTRALSAYLPQTINATATPAGGDGATMPVTPVNPAAQSLAAGVTPLADPVQEALRAEVLRASAGQLPTPELDRQFREEELALRNALFQQLGANYELSTGGSMRLQQLRESQSARREAYRLNVLTALAPQEQARRAFSYQYPLSVMTNLLPEERARAGQAENIRSTGLGERASLSANLGRTAVPTLATGLSSFVPISPLLGIEDSAAAARQSQALQTQAALESFRTGRQDQQSLAAGLAGLFGAAAGSLAQPNRLQLVST